MFLRNLRSDCETNSKERIWNGWRIVKDREMSAYETFVRTWRKNRESFKGTSLLQQDNRWPILSTDLEYNIFNFFKVERYLFFYWTKLLYAITWDSLKPSTYEVLRFYIIIILFNKTSVILMASLNFNLFNEILNKFRHTVKFLKNFPPSLTSLSVLMTGVLM